MDEWIENRQQALISTPANKRPKNTERPVISRTWNERRAMARAVTKAWNDAINSGMLIKTENGYKLCQTP